ncbi:MAG TPA: TonB-dependent receptor [Candidatus Sulfomarinibacteraceae bacterium]|nr:TonB-dependent receptor [Candidatus Sulfomarinibacteraceae bacterium]
MCLLALPGPPALAQQSVFTGTVTVTATGAETPLEEVPLPVTVIDREEIDDSQEESVADLLRRVPGLTVARAGDDGSVASVFTRGTESDHTLALFDGVRLSSPYFGGYDWSLLPTAGLARVEVARGPFSALWGADAVGGVINVVPAQATDGLGASLLAEGGEDDWRRLEGVVGWAGDGFDLYASGVDREGEGELDNSDFDLRQVLVDAGWSWGDGNRVAVLLQDLESEIGIPFSDPTSLTPNRRQRADQRLLAVPVRLRVSESWDLELVPSVVERELTFRDPDDPFGFTASDTAADTTQARLASRLALGDHHLTWGGEWREDEVTDSSVFGVNLDGATTSVASAFVQDVWQAGRELNVIAGVRWDDADEWGSEVSPRLAVGWRPLDRLELRAAYGRAFRQPSVGELYFPFSGNPELEPERSESAELGLSWLAGPSRLQLNAFATRIEDLVDFDYATYAFANVAEAEMRGVELAWDAPLGSELVSMAQLTWLDTENEAGEPLLRRPEWSASWTLHGELWGPLSGALTVLWVGSRPDVEPTTFERVELGGHVTADLSLACELLTGLELLLRVRNLADESYQEIAGYPASGRRVTGGLRWTL